MARYLIGTALTQKGIVKKHQPVDKFRKLLIKQRVSFSEKTLDPMKDRIDLELKNGEWDRVITTTLNKVLPSLRERTHIDEFPVTIFEF